MLKKVSIIQKDAVRIAEVLEGYAEYLKIVGDQQYNKVLCYANHLRNAKEIEEEGSKQTLQQMG